MKIMTKRAARPEPPTLEDPFVAQRLNKVAARGRVEEGLYLQPPKPPEPPRVRRLFWTPDEL